VEPKDEHKQSLILLHGRGSTGEKFGTEWLDSQTSYTDGPTTLRPIFPHVRFIFPTARKRRAKWYNRAMINQWFDSVPIDEQDSHGMSPPEVQWQVEGLRESGAFLKALVDQEVTKVGAENVFIGGLSQGCAMGLHLLLSYEGSGESREALGGFVGMSGWLPFAEEIEDVLGIGEKKNMGEDDEDYFGDDDDPFATGGEGDDATFEDSLQNAASASQAAQVVNFVRDNMDLPSLPGGTSQPLCLTTPVFLGHGTHDQKVLVSKVLRAAKVLEAVGFQEVAWKEYDEGHWYKVPEQIDVIARFLRRRAGR
jgi:predicted esterase